MSKRAFLLIAVAVLLVGTAATASAADKEGPADPKEMSGQDLYKSMCKPCHLPDSDAGEYTPMTLIQEQWEEFFAEIFDETHKSVVCPQDKEKKVTDHFDAEMLEKVRQFCIDHAADSEQPMTCG